MRCAVFGEIYPCTRLGNFFNGVGRNIEQMRVIFVHRRLHNFSRFCKSDSTCKIFGTRAKSFLLAAAEDDGAEVTLLYQLTAQKECTDACGAVDLMCADAEKVDILRPRM